MMPLMIMMTMLEKAMMVIMVSKDSCVGDSGSGLMREIQIPGDYFPRSEKILSFLVGKLS